MNTESSNYTYIEDIFTKPGAITKIKLVSKNEKLYALKESQQKISKEYHTMSKVESSRIAKPIEKLSENSFVMEYFPKGNASRLVGLTETQAKDHFLSICKCVEVLHSHKIVHLDLRLQNFVIADDNDIKLIDFGHATDKNCENIIQELGTSNYNGPERTCFPYNGFAADIYSLGVILGLMISGKHLFPKSNQSFQSYSLFRNNIELFWNKFENLIRRNIPEFEVSEKAKDLIEWMLEENPDDRPSIQEVLTHQFFVKNV